MGHKKSTEMKKLLLIGLLIFNACKSMAVNIIPLPSKWVNVTKVIKTVWVDTLPLTTITGATTGILRIGGMNDKISCAVWHGDGHCSWYDDVDTLVEEDTVSHTPGFLATYRTKPDTICGIMYVCNISKIKRPTYWRNGYRVMPENVYLDKDKKGLPKNISVWKWYAETFK